MKNTNNETLNYRRYICETCGFIFDEANGDPVGGIAPGTRFEDIPEDWVCSLCGDPKSSFVLMEEKAKSDKYKSASKDEHIIIIGSGHAGWLLAEAIRELSDDVAITMLTKSNGDYYNRPLLSKEIGDKNSDVIIEDASKKADSIGLNLITECEVIGIDKAKRIVITDKGIYNYQKLVIASGSATASRLGENLQSVYTIDQVEDYEVLKKNLKAKDHIAVIGGGLIGCEVADSLRSHQFDVTLINKHDHLLKKLIPQPVADQLHKKFCNIGITVKNETQVLDIQEEKGTLVCTLSQGEHVRYDKIILCVGTKAIVGFSERAGLKTGAHGLIVDEYMRSVDPHIYAIGDCVEFQGMSYRYLSSISKQISIVANELIHDDQALKYEYTSNIIKVKTPSFPITIHQYKIGESAKTWKIVNTQDNVIKVEMLNGDNTIGCVEGGVMCK